MSILEGELADTIADALDAAGVPFALTLTRHEIPSSPAYDPWDPPPAVPVDYECRGFVDQYSEAYKASGLVEVDDVKIVIVANTIETAPALGDTITARGNTYTIISAQADPALATWEVQARA